MCYSLNKGDSWQLQKKNKCLDSTKSLQIVYMKNWDNMENANKIHSFLINVDCYLISDSRMQDISCFLFHHLYLLFLTYMYYNI